MPRVQVRTDKLFAKPFEWEVAERRLSFSPLTLGDIAELTSHLRSVMLRPALESIKSAGLSGPDKAAVLDAAFRAIRDVDLMRGGETTEQLFGDVSTVIRILHLSVRRSQPKISFEEVGDWFSMQNTDDLNRLVIEIIKASGFPVRETDASEAEGGKEEEAEKAANFRPDNNGAGDRDGDRMDVRGGRGADDGATPGVSGTGNRPADGPSA